MNFDLRVQNQSGHTIRLSELVVDVFDHGGNLVAKKTINSDGILPGIEVVSARPLLPDEVVDVFNPFFSFPKDTPITKLTFEGHFLIEDNPKQTTLNQRRLPLDYDLTASITVAPIDYQSKTSLQLPLHGRLLVWEGHDFFAHHRRIPLDTDRSKKLGIEGTNANRYASDLVAVDEHGAMFHGDAFDKTNYYIYGRPIYSPSAGVVRTCRNDVPDNEFEGKRIRYPNCRLKKMTILATMS
jgi:hypothetical protein